MSIHLGWPRPTPEGTINMRMLKRSRALWSVSTPNSRIVSVPVIACVCPLSARNRRKSDLASSSSSPADLDVKQSRDYMTSDTRDKGEKVPEASLACPKLFEFGLRECEICPVHKIGQCDRFTRPQRNECRSVCAIRTSRAFLPPGEVLSDKCSEPFLAILDP